MTQSFHCRSPRVQTDGGP